MNDEHWEIRFEMSEDEAMAGLGLANTVIQKGTPILNVLSFAMSHVLGPLGVTWLIFEGLELSGKLVFSEVAFLTLTVVFGIVSAIIWMVLGKALKQIAKLAVNNSFGRKTGMIIEPSGLSVYSEHSHWRTSWVDVQAVAGDENSLVVIIAATGIAAPRRAFSGSQDADAVLAAMRRWQGAEQ